MGYAALTALVFGIFFVITLFLARIAEILAPLLGLTDRVDHQNQRKIHSHPRPIGGAAFFPGFIAILFFLPSREIISLVVGGVLVGVMGLIDDIRGLNPKLKLLLQAIAALGPITGGIVISSLDVFNLELGIFGIPFTLLWIVGVTNAFNLIDGLDGLASGGAAIASLFVIFLALNNGVGEVVLLSAALLGASLGFLRYNFHPARLFLGDSGSYFLGFLLSALVVIADEGNLSFSAVLILGLPIADTLWAIIRRLASGQSILVADRGHIHHRLLKLGWGYKKTVLFLYGIFIILGALGLVISQRYN
jgi:UDP-GlcNAc:undecaprenyl-phosphate GlcNAc-1-phosphate transferase